MNIQNLQYFVAFSEELNYTKAAEKCFVSRQALQQSIHSLEKEYDVTLVINRHNKLSLTPAGQRLCLRAKPILDSLDILEADLREFSEMPVAIRLGVSKCLRPFYAPEYSEKLGQLETCFPDFRCSVKEEDPDTLLEKLETKALDAAIVIDMECIEGYDRTVLRKDSVRILMAGNHPLSHKKLLCPKDFAGYTILTMGEPERFYRPFMKFLQDIPVKFQVEYDFYEALRLLYSDQYIALNRSTPGPAQRFVAGINLPLITDDLYLETVLLTKKTTTNNYLSRICDQIQNL